IHFDVEIDDSGKARAINASIEGVSSVFNPDQALVLSPKQSVKNDKLKPSGRVSSYRIAKPNRSRSRAGLTLVYLLVIVVGLFIYDKVPRKTELVNSITEPVSEVEEVKDTPQYHCEGKTRCPEMTSCEEARYYLNNCPGTEMDGDHDGIPCESQWCN
ncbi:MAG TPA: excalibur calcium-binding domain-containing protein, partial [Methylococcaceae bacterium]|nr:excalibur calcium-binding domain-containing protein [Methylococcaceae bacterium]